MSTTLDAIRNLIHRLADYGVTVAVVGGAARDTYLGREPKDYDFIVLNNTSDLALLDIIEACTGYTARSLSPETKEQYDEGKDRGLEDVLESGITDPRYPSGSETLKVQFLVYTPEVTARFAGDPYNAVEEHDCDLSKAWFEDVGGRLVARVHPEFPSPFNGNVNHFKTGYSDTLRKQYIALKFPEFEHRN